MSGREVESLTKRKHDSRVCRVSRAIVQLITGFCLFVFLLSQVTIFYFFSIQPSKLKVLPERFLGEPLAMKKKVSSVTNVCAKYSESDTQFFDIALNLYMTLNNSLRWASCSI